MRTKHTFLFLVLGVVFLISLFANQSTAQVNVTMRVNTSTNPDTLSPTGFVFVCGESKKGTTPAITWDAKTTGISANTIGGDYWEATFQAQPGDTISFKFVTFFDAAATQNTVYNWGWEGTFLNTDTRRLIVGQNDTTLAVQYYHGSDAAVDQYWKPFESKTDTIAVYFRVNMGGAEFDPATQLVDVRGGLPLGGATDWITIKTLSQEVNSVNAGSFWSGVSYVAINSVTAGITQQQWKFVIQPDKWESVGNRSFVFSGTNDTTIHWYYYDNIAPSGPPVDADLLFRLKLDGLEKAGLFDRSLGDKVAVTGAKGWPPTDFVPTDFDTEPSMIKMTYNSDLEEWGLLETFTKFPNSVIEYKYYIAWDTSRVDSTSPNYIPGLDLSNGWEEPGVRGGGNRLYTYSDQTTQLLPGDFGYEQQFFNSIPAQGVITNPIDVTFKINMTPATDINANPTNPLFRPGIDTVYIQFGGSFVPVTQGLPMYGITNRIRLEDPDGDLIYKNIWSLNPPTFYQLCYTVVYTSPSGDIGNGGGILSGRRYYQYVRPSSIEPVVWPSSFDLAEMQWMNDSLTVEVPPNLGLTVGITGKNNGQPNQYALYQNYPNPFNPSTIITYSILNPGNVRIEVYNIVGEKVITLVNQTQTAGVHSLVWNSINDNGTQVNSGVYLLKMQSGNFSKVQKLLLLK